MDVSNLQQVDTFRHTLRHPDGSELDVVFTLAGPTHPIREALEKKQTARALRGHNKYGKQRLPEDPDELLAMQVARVASLVLGWEKLEVDGKVLEYSVDAAREFFALPRFQWIRLQIVRELDNDENFIGSSSTS